MKKKFLIVSLAFLISTSFAQTDTVANIELFGRVWGMIKYYHPAIQKNKLDWNNVFIEHYNQFKNARNAADYNLQLKKLLDTLGPVFKDIKPYQYFPDDTTVCNLHFNWVESSSVLDSQSKMYLTDLIRFYHPRKNSTIENENSKGYDMSQVVWENPKIYPGEAKCMLAFFNYWNRINYSFAYKKLMDIPWDKTVGEFIPEIRKAAGSRAFYLKMAELTTRLNDGHAWCVNKEVYDETGSSMNIPIDYVSGRTFISPVNDSLSVFLGVHGGDEILETNGIPLEQRRKYLDTYIGGSTANGIDLIKNTKILGIKKYTPFSLKIRDTLGIEKTLYFNGDSLFYKKLMDFANRTPNEVPFKFITSNYGYIDAGITSNRNIKKAFRKFRKTKAIIIDNRKYGGGNRHLYAHYLTNKNNPYALYYQSDRAYPGAFKKLIFHSNFLRTSYFKKKYKGKVIVLIDEHTASGMEFNTMCLQATGKVIIIGRNSAGYDGVCRPFLIQPDFGAAYSEDAVFYPDGKQTQRIGVIPDIYVGKTLNGVRRNQDEILERAIRYLNESTN
jgi:C-terminal processing protease CtpA/Prc